MSVITFTEEKKTLIGDWLKANCGGRRWHEVKAKKQDQAEQYADDIIAKNAAINAEREAAEVLRQERLAMPAERLYDGIDLTHQPIVKTESSLPVYKSMFRVDDDDLQNGLILEFNFSLRFHVLAMTARLDYKLMDGTKHSEVPKDYSEAIGDYGRADLIKLFGGISKKNENNLEFDLKVIKKLNIIYNKMARAFNNHTHFVNDPKSAYDRAIKKEYVMDKEFKKIVIYVLNNLIGYESEVDYKAKTDKFMNDVGYNYVNEFNKIFVEKGKVFRDAKN